LTKEEVVADSGEVDVFGSHELNSSRLRRPPMHDFLAGLVFVAIVMTPCVLALTVKLDDRDSKFDR
jgi:hypothetical protein